MRKRVRIALAVVLVAIAGVIGWQMLRFSEPVYEGKPFSFWLDRIPCTMVLPTGGVSMIYPGAYPTKADREKLIESTDKALNAVNRIGGQCLPMLVRRLRTQDSPLKMTMAQWAVRLHLIHASWIRPAAIVRGQALTAIIKLDYSAKPIFSDLALLAHDKDPSVRAAAKYALERLNPEEVERLERLQQTPRTRLR